MWARRCTDPHAVAVVAVELRLEREGGPDTGTSRAPEFRTADEFVLPLPAAP